MVQAFGRLYTAVEERIMVMVGAFRVWGRDRLATESINAGHIIAAIAGALGIRLEKLGHYIINAGGRAPNPNDIIKALTIAKMVATLYTTLIITALLLGCCMY